MRFSLSETEWLAACNELVGHPVHGAGARADIEGICGAFIHRRKMHGRDFVTPKGEAKAWRKVADLADELAHAIGDLEWEELALNTFLDPREWGSQLQRLSRNSRWFATAATTRKRRGNNVDQVRDEFIFGLIQLWAGYGLSVGAGWNAYDQTADGPLIRFVEIVAGAAFEELGDPAPTANAIREIVRKRHKW